MRPSRSSLEELAGGAGVGSRGVSSMMFVLVCGVGAQVAPTCHYVGRSEIRTRGIRASSASLPWARLSSDGEHIDKRLVAAAHDDIAVHLRDAINSEHALEAPQLVGQVG